MQNFITALKAEHLKKKRTGIYVTSAILGIISPLIMILVMFFENSPERGGMPYNYYLDLIQDTLDPFAGFFFPLLIIITVSRITQIDHRNGGWQLMETQPLNKISIYFSKFSIVLIAMLISIFSLVAACYLFGWIYSLVNDIPEQAATSFAFAEIFWLVARLLLAGLLLAAFQYIISVLMPSFIWSILIGFFLLLAFIFLKAFNVTPDWYPLEPLSKVSGYRKGSDLGYWITYSETASFLLSFILLYLGFKWYKHKGFKAAFFGKGNRIAMLLAVLVIAGGLLAYTLMPVEAEPHSRTVVAGKVESDRPLQNVYIRDMFIHDTVAVIPIKDNKFHAVIPQDVALDKYEILFDEVVQKFAIFGKNDSTYIDLKLNKTASSDVITGTRLAENRFSSETNISGMVAYYVGRNQFMENPDFIMKQLVDEWEDAMDESGKFKTVDNYVPRPDFLEKQKKIMTVQYLNTWDSYVTKRAALYPDQKTEESEDLKKIKATITLNDESLMTDNEYLYYVMTQLTANNKADISEDDKNLMAIAKMPAGSFKDKMLYYQLNKSVNEASGKMERDTLIANYASGFEDNRYKSIIENTANTLESISSGKQAPLFDAITLDNKPVNLADLRGKYVVIDVWATWCGPCKYESPYFDKIAIKYKDNDQIQFVAASIDDNIQQWFIDAKAKSKSVLQLHINDKKQFSKDYNAQSIPRFILIDPDGNFVDSNLTRPSEKGFENSLREALGLAKQK